VVGTILSEGLLVFLLYNYCLETLLNRDSEWGEFTVPFDAVTLTQWQVSLQVSLSSHLVALELNCR